MTRVLMTGDCVGGVWSFTLQLAESLAPEGVKVLLAAMGGEPSAAQRAEAAKIPNLRLLTRPYKLEWMNDPWDDIEASRRWLWDLAQAFAPDVIHLNSYGHGAMPFNAPTVLTAHSCVLSWWRAVKQEPVPAHWSRYRDEVRHALQTVDVVAAPTSAMLHTLGENYGADIADARVVFNGLDPERFLPSPKEPFILSAGRLWDEAKNIATLASVAGELEWPVYVAGESSHPDGIAPDLGACGPLGNLAPQDLAAWYGRAAIYALPARYEPFGLSILEAALAGCALVLGDIASLREIWGDAAIFVSPNRPDQLEAALAALIARPALREEMSRRGTARARSFTADRMAQTYMNLYCSMAPPMAPPVAPHRRATCVS